MRDQPKRIQRRRAKGWRMPPNTIYVGRLTYWGNRWAVGVHSNLLGRVIETPAEAVHCYRCLLADTPIWRSRAREVLRGRDLVCWCPLDQPCHADVLLEIANA